MEATIDTMGRIVVPKPLREALGLIPGAKVDISRYGVGLQVLPGGRTARLVRDANGQLVSKGTTVVDDETVFSLIDSVRK